MPIPIRGDNVLLKPEVQLLEIARDLNWYGDDRTRQSIARKFGDTKVNVKQVESHHSYFFSEDATFHFKMISRYL